MVKEEQKEKTAFSYRQGLFDLMHKEHGLILVESELDDIVTEVEKLLKSTISDRQQIKDIVTDKKTEMLGNWRSSKDKDYSYEDDVTWAIEKLSNHILRNLPDIRIKLLKEQ